jgi:hypothetical protein
MSKAYLALLFFFSEDGKRLIVTSMLLSVFSTNLAMLDTNSSILNPINLSSNLLATLQIAFNLSMSVTIQSLPKIYKTAAGLVFLFGSGVSPRETFGHFPA